MGFGLQFCPACLAEDATPYFRKCWRVALNTVCSRHKTMLLDRCPSCGAAIAAHRLDFNQPNVMDEASVSFCHRCGFDLCTALAAEPISYDSLASVIMAGATENVAARPNEQWSIGRYAVLHQLCRLMTARYQHVALRTFVLQQIGAHDISLSQGHISFEMRPLAERHHLLQLTAWLLVDLEPRLRAAWQSGAVRYSVLAKDFLDRPNWYGKIVGNWGTGERRTRSDPAYTTFNLRPRPPTPPPPRSYSTGANLVVEAPNMTMRR